MGLFERGEMNESVATLGATWTSTVLDLDTWSECLIAATVASNTDAVGTISVEASNDKANWYTVPFADSSGTVSTTFAVTAGLNTTEPFLVGFFSHFRVKYTRTSGGAAATLALAANMVR